MSARKKIDEFTLPKGSSLYCVDWSGKEFKCEQRESIESGINELDIVDDGGVLYMFDKITIDTGKSQSIDFKTSTISTLEIWLNKSKEGKCSVYKGSGKEGKTSLLCSLQ